MAPKHTSRPRFADGSLLGGSYFPALSRLELQVGANLNLPCARSGCSGAEGSILDAAIKAKPRHVVECIQKDAALHLPACNRDSIGTSLVSDRSVLKLLGSCNQRSRPNRPGVDAGLMYAVFAWPFDWLMYLGSNMLT